MTKISSLEELKKLGDELQARAEAKKQKGNSAAVIQIKVALATCGIASGAKAVMDYMKEELEKRNIPAEVTQTGCMCYCYAEPTIEVTVPGKEPVVFGYVNTKKADEIIEKYIRKGEVVEGVIERNYETIDSK